MENIEIKFGKKFMVIDGVKIDVDNRIDDVIGGRIIFYDKIEDIKFTSMDHDYEIKNKTIWVKTNSVSLSIRNIASFQIEEFLSKLNDATSGKADNSVLIL